MGRLTWAYDLSDFLNRFSMLSSPPGEMRAGQRWVGLTIKRSILAIQGELGTTVLLPAGLVLFGAELLFLAVADHAEAGGSAPCGDQRGARGAGAVLTES